MILTEENGYYALDCDRAIWATDDQHNAYHKFAVSFLKDVDWFLETEAHIMMIEYKNGTVYKSENLFDPLQNGYIDSVVRKFYDSLHYLTLLGKNKPKKYIYIVEYPNDDSVSRKMLRNNIAKKLPFKLQNNLSQSIKLIDEFAVMSINEWNKEYPEFPMIKTEDFALNKAASLC